MSGISKRPIAGKCLAIFLAAILTILPLAPALADTPVDKRHFTSRPQGSTEEITKPSTDPSSTNDAPKLDFTLTQAESPKTADQESKIAIGEPLSPQRLHELVDRLSQLPPHKKQEFRFPEQSLVRPKLPGKIANESFPPNKKSGTEKPQVETKAASVVPLQVIDIKPGGATDDAGEVAITFSQPMVNLPPTNDGDPSDIVKMTPQPPGQWEWAGTQTLLFHPSSANHRLPKSTTYKLFFPDTAKSAVGGKMIAAQEYTFSTPSLQITNSFPRADIALTDRPLLVLFFNQDIDQKEIISHMRLTDGKNNEYPISLVERDKLANEKVYQEQVKDLSQSQWICVQPSQRLPLSNRYKLSILKGCPAKEGSEVTATDQSVEFLVHGPMKLTSPKKVNFSSESTISLHFTNPIGGSKEQLRSLLKIQPPIRDCCYAIDRDHISISGKFQPYTKYKVSADSSIQDIFGQKLGKTETIEYQSDSFYTSINTNHPFVTIAPGQKPEVAFIVKASPQVNIDVFRVTSADWLRYKKINWDHDPDATVGTHVLNKSYPIGTGTKCISCDLSNILAGKNGMFVLHASCWDDKHHKQHHAHCWTQVTNLGLDAFIGQKLVVLATKLSDGSPIEGAIIKPMGHDLNTTDYKTDASGQTTISAESKDVKALSISTTDDAAILPWESYWKYEPIEPTIKWYCVPDRSLYKPGQIVHVKGWQRGFRLNDKHAIELFTSPSHTIHYTATGVNGTQLFSGDTKVDAAGGFSFEGALPKTLNLGSVSISVYTDSISLGDEDEAARPYSTMCTVSVQEFRRPEFEMKARAAKSSCLFGEPLQISAQGNYFGGGPLAHTSVNWTVAARPAGFCPPSFNDYVFGEFDTWLYRNMPQSWRGNKAILSKTIEGISDSQGRNSIDVTVKELAFHQAQKMSCEATIIDLNRQQWSDTTSFILHPSKIYVGLKPDYNCAQHDVKVQAVAVDIAGTVVSGRPITLKLQEPDEEGNLKTLEIKEIVSEAAPSTVSFNVASGAHVFIVDAAVKDEEGRINETTTRAFAYSTSRYRNPIEEWATRSLPPLDVTVKSDKENYKAGETAALTITSSKYPCYGLAVISRNSIVKSIPLELKSGPQTLTLPISEEDYPNLFVDISLSAENGEHGHQYMEVCVPPVTKEMVLSVVPQKTLLRPGSNTAIDVNLKDYNGSPISGGHVALAVVDEALLSLQDHSWRDPLPIFYPQFKKQRSAESSRSTIFQKMDNTPPDKGPLRQTTPEVIDQRHYTSEREEHKQLGYASGRERYTSFMVANARILDAHLQQEKQTALNKLIERLNFSELALFAPDIKTDESGRASVPLHLPDSITKYRILAAAVSGSDKYAAATSAISTKLDLAIKPSLPRFLNFGDRCELPFVIQNQTDKPVVAEVVMRAQNAVVEGSSAAAPQAAGKKITVAANDRVEVRFPIATQNAGDIDVQCAVFANNSSDAARLSIPVYVPASLETYAAYGQIDRGATLQKLKCPAEAMDHVGGLSLTTSSTALQALTDAFIYLENYPNACSEQLSAKVLSALSLHDTLVAFNCLPADLAGGYRVSVQKTLDILVSRQNEHGGFGLWGKEEDGTGHPYASIQTAQALLLAQKKDFKVDQNAIDLCRRYLKGISIYIPASYSYACRSAIQAKALNVRYLDNDIDSAEAQEVLFRLLNEHRGAAESITPENISSVAVVNSAKSLPLEYACWLLPVLSRDKSRQPWAEFLRRTINNSIKETASTASTDNCNYEGWSYLLYYSPHRVDALALLALIEDQPDSHLIPKLAKGLLAHKKNGAWDGTQENCSALLALDKYFATYEKDTPNFESQEWLGNELIGQQKFAGRSTESKQISIPIGYLKTAKSEEITISKNGPGRLYYRLALDYSPTNLKVAAKSRGFAVRREYEAVDNKSDVRKDESGIWHIKAGSSVRCKIKFDNIGTRYHVALMAPIPGGCELVNTTLAGNRKAATDQDKRVPSNWRYRWNRSWYEHQNMRDHQAEAFASLLSPGSHDYTCTMNATTPGRFIVPPAKAEEMYSSETFGRTASDIVFIDK